MAILNNKILYGIVTYKEQFWKCTSFVTLLESYKKYGDELQLNVFIFDNTENKDWINSPFYQKEVKIEYFNNNINHGISIAYNTISRYAEKMNFDWIVFLDQDTSLPIDFYRVYREKSLKLENNFKPIAIPLIYSTHKLISPSKFINYRSFRLNQIDSNFLDLKNISCINSGLMIKSDFFKKVGGYNEKLKLDFCDHDFIETVKKYTNQLEILDIKINQNFSSETDDIKKAIFRYKIFLKDLQEYKINRSSLILFVFIDFPHLLKLSMKFKSINFFKIRVRYFFKV